VCRWTSLFVDRHEVAVLPGEEYEGWQAPRRDTKVGHATNKDFMITAVAYAVRLTFEVSEGTGNHRRSIAASFIRDAAPLVRAALGEPVRQVSLRLSEDRNAVALGFLPVRKCQGVAQ